MYDSFDLTVVIIMLAIGVMLLAACNARSDLGRIGCLLVIVGFIFGWPFAALGVALLVVNGRRPGSV